MEALAIHTWAPIVYWEDNTSCISIVESKGVTYRVKHVDTPVCFLQEHLTMISLFQNMGSLLSCQFICVPNHARVQLSVGLLNE